MNSILKNIYEPFLIGFMISLATMLHTILLLNPLWFRERALGWFTQHHYLRYFSMMSLWFTH